MMIINQKELKNIQQILIDHNLQDVELEFDFERMFMSEYDFVLYTVSPVSEGYLYCGNNDDDEDYAPYFSKWVTLMIVNGIPEFKIDYTYNTGYGDLYNLDTDGWDELGASKEEIEEIIRILDAEDETIY